MPKDFYHISVITANREQVLAKFSESRYLSIAYRGDLEKKLDQLVVSLTKDLTHLSTQALKSTTPIHRSQGGTLRNQHIQNNLSSIAKSRPEGRVWFDDSIHRPPYSFGAFRLYGDIRSPLKSERPPASRLAELLERGGPRNSYNRTRPSEPEPGFHAVLGETALFIEKARDQYVDARTRFLATDKDIDTFLSSPDIAEFESNEGAYYTRKGKLRASADSIIPSRRGSRGSGGNLRIS